MEEEGGEGERGNEPNENMNETREREQSPKSIPVERKEQGPRRRGGRIEDRGGGERRGVSQGWVSYGQGSGAAVVASTLPSLSVAPRFPGSADRQAG